MCEAVDDDGAGAGAGESLMDVVGLGEAV